MMAVKREMRKRIKELFFENIHNCSKWYDGYRFRVDRTEIKINGDGDVFINDRMVFELAPLLYIKIKNKVNKINKIRERKKIVKNSIIIKDLHDSIFKNKGLLSVASPRIECENKGALCITK